MKKIKINVLLILSIVCIINIHAELKHFLPRSNAYMSVHNKRFSFDGDTIINDIRYTKVYEQYGDSETEFEEPSYYAAVREDTLAEKIYCIQVDDGVERLLADFSVQAGEEVKVSSFLFRHSSYMPSVERYAFVETVDSVLINDQYRKRIVMSCEYESFEESWIEGIGSTRGLFFPAPEVIMDIEEPPLLLCFHVNDILIYQAPSINTCFLFPRGASIVDNQYSNISVFPTFVKDYLHIESYHCFYSYKIFNNQGINVLSGVLSTYDIQVSSLNNDIYYIILYSGNKPIYSGKFIKI